MSQQTTASRHELRADKSQELYADQGGFMLTVQTILGRWTLLTKGMLLLTGHQQAHQL